MLERLWLREGVLGQAQGMFLSRHSWRAARPTAAQSGCPVPGPGLQQGCCWVPLTMLELLEAG